MSGARKGATKDLGLVGALRTIRSIAASMPQSTAVHVGGDRLRDIPTLWGEVYAESTQALRAYGYPVDRETDGNPALEEMIEALSAAPLTRSRKEPTSCNLPPTPSPIGA